MSAYVDTSALRRLLIDDEHSEALESFLLEQDHVATSDLALTELHRVAGWHDLDPAAVDELLGRFDRVLPPQP